MSSCYIEVKRSSWRAYRKICNIRQFNHPGNGGGTYHFLYTMTPGEYYPRIHFQCNYRSAPGYAIVNIHDDIAPHINGQDYEELVFLFRNTLESFDRAYQSIINSIHKRQNARPRSKKIA